jgi:hypothetical protein
MFLVFRVIPFVGEIAVRSVGFLVFQAMRVGCDLGNNIKKLRIFKVE